MNAGERFYTVIQKLGAHPRPKRLRFYLEHQFLKGIDIEGKRILDVGGGYGLYALYCITHGASEVIVLEPQLAGSRSDTQTTFERLLKAIRPERPIRFVPRVVEEFVATEGGCFDIIMMHNSINHIDEEACAVLDRDEAAREYYRQFFIHLAQISRSGTELVIADCARRNVFGDLGLRNPLLPSIEWYKHQSPQLWGQLLEEVGFRTQSIDWTSPNVLGRLGRWLFNNAVMAYLTMSHFRLVAEYQGGGKENVSA